jgi:hypothetical protein
MAYFWIPGRQATLVEYAPIHVLEEGVRRVDARRDQHALFGGAGHFPDALGDLFGFHHR